MLSALVRAKSPARTGAKDSSPARVLCCGRIYLRRTVRVKAVFLEPPSIIAKARDDNVIGCAPACGCSSHCIGAPRVSLSNIA